MRHSTNLGKKLVGCKRMMELMSGGTTVLFVSHNLEQIREMCSKVVWLEHGTVQMVGDTKEVCDAYAKA